MKIGLVLEGGGMRTLFTAGVLDAFLDKHIEVNGVVGVSAGALFGVNYISKQKERSVRYNKKYSNEKKYMGFYSWITTGNAVNKDFAFYKIPFKLDKFDEREFEKAKVDFYVVMTNIESGKPEYVLIKDVFKQMEYLRATSALPFASKIIKINNKKYLDGGISNSIPVDFFEKQDFDKVIVILTRPITYRKEKTTGIQYKMFYKKYPKLVEKLESRYKEYNDTVDKIVELEKAGKLFVIRPSENITIKRLEKDVEKLQKVYDLGLKDGNNIIEDLKQYLEK